MLIEKEDVGGCKAVLIIYQSFAGEPDRVRSGDVLEEFGGGHEAVLDGLEPLVAAAVEHGDIELAAFGVENSCESCYLVGGSANVGGGIGRKYVHGADGNDFCAIGKVEYLCQGNGNPDARETSRTCADVDVIYVGRLCACVVEQVAAGGEEFGAVP